MVVSSKMKLSFLICFVLAQVSTPENESPTLLINGGKSVDIKDYQYQLALFDNKQGFICGAALIGVKYVLTAAHCTLNRSSKELYVRAGSSYREEGKPFNVKNIHNHPNFTNTFFTNDISRLELSTTIEIENARPIKYAKIANYEVGDFVKVTGWGYGKGNKTLANQLQMIEIQILPTKVCRSKYGESWIATKICAGDTANGKDSCTFDSGGPLVLNGIVIGVVSAGDCEENLPGLYSDVAAASNFIKEITGDSQGRLEINLILIGFIVFMHFGHHLLL